ncbi:tetraacyldisaccharide 4'-kinase [Dysgonomonas sp. 216]|uniref:tetraacyldisaccharide 4'-kinase n=1 Tax=Dysgonomonas sp. 216 TaxID=2302934 RepID=UPI0013D7B2CB|nr:tetraacyldisaccharide 4'-kinase [Dysgonomonas sp. 216]NDW18424.1 tetraacyldisaccharide 4'-kinase [Dysgonomonas sp. 216]
MSKNKTNINKWLLPLSWLYGFVVFIRKKLFDWNILKQVQYDVPVICVGNITVGGTGKTPHIEYLVRLLKTKYRVAVLSRGYRRKTKGFVLATPNTDFKKIGDEPFQIKNKFPDIIVAVDENRRHGIETLLAMDDRPEVILLDDAYQHRYVKPSFSVLLVNYNRPIYEDTLLPAGRLREPAHNLDRANVVIITKCPQDLKPIDMRIMTHDINTYPYQSLLFSTTEYGDLIAMFDRQNLFESVERPLEYIRNKKVLLVAGIASPDQLVEEIKKYTENVQLMNFPDHHDFSDKDIQDIEERFKEMGNDTITILTEKDAARLTDGNKMSERLKASMYYLPVKISFLSKEDERLFMKKIVRHVYKSTRDGEIYQEEGF